jgi:hypothetical protein
MQRPFYPTTHSTCKRERLPCPWGDSNPQSQQAGGHRHMTYTMRPLGSAVEPILYFSFLWALSISWLRESTDGYLPDNPHKRLCPKKIFTWQYKIYCLKLPGSKSVLFKTCFSMINGKYWSCSQQL